MSSSFRSLNPKDLWDRRELAILLFWREIKVRYKQSMLGGLWAVIRPLILMVVFSYLFGEVAQLPTEGVPYSLFVFSAILCWDLFSNIVTGCAGSIISNRSILDRTYCPRLILPLSSVLVALFDFGVAFIVFIFLLILYGYMPPLEILYLPLLVLVTILAGLSFGLWLAAISVWLRDIKFLVGYLLQLMMLLTPVGYAATAVPEKYQFLTVYNPLSTLVEIFRWSFLGVSPPEVSAVISAGMMITIFLLMGLWFFAVLERSFADVI